jgi:hypothetical protein
MTTIIEKLYNNLKKPVDTEIIEKNIERILSKNIDKRVGLVYGKVQSGKTNSIICLTGKLIDNDYRLIIYLISDLKELLGQNFDRIRPIYDNGINKVFKNYEGDILLFNTSDDRFKILDKDKINNFFQNDKTLIICTLKNHSHLNKILTIFKDTPYCTDKSIIIDDEGDDISQNTSKQKIQNGKEENRSRINDSLIQIKNMLNCGLISITATPQANLFLETIQSLSPDYCAYFEPSRNYTGLEIFHTENSIIEVVKENTDSIYKNDEGIPLSMRNALNYFIVSSSVLKFLNNKYYKTQMLIHPDKKTNSHRVVTEKINLIIKEDYLNLNNTPDSGTSKEIIKNFKDLYLDFKIKYKTLPDFEEFLEKYIQETLLNLETFTLNSKNKKSMPLKDVIEISRTNLILVGGDMLDRGVTIPNLIVSFMLRDSKIPQADTLIQRARWLGYRENLDFTKVYLTQSLHESYLKLVEHEDDLSESIKFYSDENLDMKKIEDLKLTLDPSLIITNKGKATAGKVDFVHPWSIQKFFTRNSSKNLENIDLIKKLFEDIKTLKFKEEYGNVFYSVKREVLISFLNKFSNSEKDGNLILNLKLIKQKLEELEIDFVDIVEMRSGSYEYRSLDEEGEGIKNLMQGRGNLENKESYPGDRNIILDKVMLQIHNVKLKQEFKLENTLIYEQNTFVPMIALGIPANKRYKILESEKNKISRKKSE